MDPWMNLTAIGPDTDPARFMDMMLANLDAVQMNNEGNAARRRGDLARAEELHREALRLKICGFGEESVQAALSFNTLGKTYLKMSAGASATAKHLDLAEANLKKVLRVRDDKVFGGFEMGPRGPAAVSRDNMARLLEARGKMDEARDMRMRGASKSQIVCGADGCVTPNSTVGALHKVQKCDGCKAVFYCHPACKQKDWTTRHKPFCEAYVATKKSAESINTATAG